MPFKTPLFYLLYICLLNVWEPLQAQNILSDSDSYQKNLLRVNPFFLNEVFQHGSVFYDGTYYDSLHLSYDMMMDQLIIQNDGIQFGVVLVSPKIDYFTIGSHFFKRLVFDSSRSKAIKTGFYERLNSDKNVVYIKRVNQISQSANASDYISRFKEYDTYWIEKEGEYYRIDNESDLRLIFRDQWPIIRKYLKNQHVRFKTDPVQTILLTVKYVSQLQDDHAKTK
jgi:hypothetical protein